MRCKACDDALTDVELRRKPPSDLCGPCDTTAQQATDNVFVEKPWSHYGQRRTAEGEE